MESKGKEMIQEKTWQEFRDAGLFWWINRTLHLFGWVIVWEYDDENNLTKVYPARTKFRGFVRESEEKGFRKLSKYLKENIEELEKETLL